MFTPFPAVVVVADNAAKQVDHGGIVPAGKLHDETGRLATEELCGTLQAPIAGLARILDAILKQREQQA